MKKIIYLLLLFNIVMAMNVMVYGEEIDINTTFKEADIVRQLSNKDANKDGKLNDEEIKSVTTLAVNSETTADLSNISKLYDIKNLYIYAAGIKNGEEIGKLKKLESIIVEDDKIKEFELTSNNTLKSLEIDGKRIEKLNLKSEAKIKKLILSVPNLKELQTNNKVIDELLIYYLGNWNQQLKKLNKVELLKILGDKLTQNINIKKFNKLKDVDVDSTSKKNIVFDKCKKLKSIKFSCESKYKNVYIKNCPKLKDVDVSEMKVKGVSIQNNKRLEIINAAFKYCHAKTKIKKVPKLKELKLHHITNKKMDLRAFHKLEKIKLTKSKTKSVKLPKKNKIKYLNLSNNKLTGINLKYLKKAKTVYLQHNKLKKVNVSKLKNVNNLDMSYNKISKINITKLINIDGCDLCHNKITGTVYLPIVKQGNGGEFYLSYNRINKIIALSKKGKNSALSVLLCNHNKLSVVNVKRENMQTIDIRYNPYVNLYYVGSEYLYKDKSAKVHNME